MITVGVMKNKLKKAITMIELLIAMVLFIIVMLIVLDSFIKVINYNRRAVQNQALQDHSEFLFQMLGREIRFAKINYANNCLSFNAKSEFNSRTFNQVYAVGEPVGSNKPLLFENANNECVAIYQAVDPALNINRLGIIRCAYEGVDCSNDNNWREAYITPADLIVEQFDVSVTNFSNSAQSSRHTPASVHYYLKLKSAIWDNTAIELDNFITARNAEQF